LWNRTVLTSLPSLSSARRNSNSTLKSGVYGRGTTPCTEAKGAGRHCTGSPATPHITLEQGEKWRASCHSAVKRWRALARYAACGGGWHRPFARRGSNRRRVTTRDVDEAGASPPGARMRSRWREPHRAPRRGPRPKEEAVGRRAMPALGGKVEPTLGCSLVKKTRRGAAAWWGRVCGAETRRWGRTTAAR
jgi:hypothetical protein